MAPAPDLVNNSMDDTEAEHLSEHLAAGTSLLNGQYVIESYLSSGGFGITYLARDSLDRPVVIKECYPEALCSRKNKTVKARSVSHANEFKSLVGMFVREARNIAKLQHPNIVGVHQIFEDNHTAYMALDLIDGQDLLQIIEEKPKSLTPAIVQSLLMKLLDAIVAVHAQDMLHRDISPDNILLDPWGSPILIDFGAAREHASKKSRAVSAFLVVKDGYSPQEFYISGGQQGPSSDLYSLAATFFHVITGEAPPNSQTRIAAIAANRTDPYQPLAGRFGKYDRNFLDAIDLAMNVFPTDRMASARDWIALIEPTALLDKPQQKSDGPDLMDQIIAELISETTKKIEEDISVEPEFVQIKKAEAPEKVWEYLSEEDLGDANCSPDPPPAEALSDEAQAESITTLSMTAHYQAQGLRRRRIGLLILAGSVTAYFYIIPSKNLTVAATARVQDLLEHGASWAPTVSQFITALL